jgi:hypothetical protein
MTKIKAAASSDPWLFGSLPALRKEQATRFIELRMAALIDAFTFDRKG